MSTPTVVDDYTQSQGDLDYSLHLYGHVDSLATKRNVVNIAMDFAR